MSEFKGLYDVRDGLIEDVPFIMATFLRGLYHGDSWFSLIPQDIFMANYHPVATALLKRPNTLVKVACLPEDPTVILGYSILNDDFQTIHWVYVKVLWRKRGIARTLLPAYPTKITHLSKIGKLLMSKFENCIFNPFDL